MKVVAELKLGDHYGTIVEGKVSDHGLYQDALMIRKQAFMKGRFYKYYDENMVVSDCDPYSKIYCLYLKEIPLGTVAVTLGSRGKMHKEHRFPDILFKTPRHKMCSIQKLCVDEDKVRNLNINPLAIHRQTIRVLEQKVKEEQVHTIVISTAISLHKFQMALGFIPLAGSEYKNEVNHMDCLILAKKL